MFIRKLFIYCFVLVAFNIQLPILADITIEEPIITQGEIFTIKGCCRYKIAECRISFQDKYYSFQTVPNPQDSKLIKYIARIPTTPLTEPGQFPIHVNCYGLEQVINVQVNKGTFLMQHINLPPDKSNIKATPLEVKLVRTALKIKTPDRYWNPLQTWTVPSKFPYSSSYGMKRTYNGVLAKNYFHKGTDFAAPTGSIVRSPAGGKVILTGKVKDGFNINGNTVLIDHGQGLISAYLHMNSILVEDGQIVHTGTQVGTVGHTGLSTGPHLHWGLYLYGDNINPIPWLKYMHE